MESESALLKEILMLRADVAELKCMVLSVNNNNQFQFDQNVEKPAKSLEGKITNILNDFMISPSIKGFSYLREAIYLVTTDWDVLDGGITKELYPAIAKKFNTKSTRVERAIRHAIEQSYDKNYSHPFYQKDYIKNRPTNSQFIAKIADQLRMEEAYEEENK